MGPGQRKYIERRIAALNDRAAWLRHHCKKPESQHWHHEELAEYDNKIELLNQRLVDAQPF